MPAELSAELNTCFTADIPHPVMVLFRVTRLFVPDLLVISVCCPDNNLFPETAFPGQYPPHL